MFFAVLGVLPVGLGLVVRSAWARSWAARETSRLLREHGLDARYEVGVRLWPASVDLTEIEVASSDGGAPALRSPRVSVFPRFFALLSGKLAIDQIEVDAPMVRIVLHAGKLVNLRVKLPEASSTGGPFHAPFSVFSIADATVDLDADDVHAGIKELDVDVTNDDDAERGSSFELSMRAGQSLVRRVRSIHGRGGAEFAIDDDQLCTLEGRVRIEPESVLVRRFTAAGAADLDAAEETQAGCHLPNEDKRKVELAVSHARVRFPTKTSPVAVDGHVHVRVPLQLAERAIELPETDGWMGVDADVRFDANTTLPEVKGHFEAHDIQLDKYRFAQEIQSDIVLERNVVTSSLTTIRISGGQATLSGIVVEPLAKGVTFKTKLEARGVSFESLMRDLGVSEHPHVAWDLRELHVPLMSGTLVPLHLDGDFTAGTGVFEVDDIAHDNPAHQRVLSFKEAELRAHASIRPEALQFKAISATLPNSKLENGFCSIGFNDELRVDLPLSHVSLKDISPLAGISLKGDTELEAHIAGKFGSPALEADASIKDFVFGDIPFGNVTAAHASLKGLVVDLKGVKAVKGKSTYEMPSARLDFGGRAGFEMDAQVMTKALGLRDFFAIWRMDDDPRFVDIDGTVAAQATLHVALGGPEDVCGGGMFDVRASAHVADLGLLGEHFDDGDVDLEYRWRDRLAGIDGADIDIHAVTLHKVHSRAGPVLGVVLGSAAIARGGAVSGSLVLQSVPLSSLDSLRKAPTQLQGALSGMMQIGGSLDAYDIRGDLDLTPIRVGGASFGASHLRMLVSQKSPKPKALGKTRCGGTIAAPFDKEAYAREPSVQSQYSLDGDVLGGQAHLDHLTLTKEKSSSVEGRVSLRKVDVGAVLQALAAPKEDTEEGGGAGAPRPLSGELSGELAIDKLPLSDIARASIRFAPTLLFLRRGGQKITLRPSGAVVRLESDAVSLPRLVFDLEAPNGLKGSLGVQGNIARVSRDAEVGVATDLAPVDLGVLVGVVPKLERSLGTLTGRMMLKGPLASPSITGEAHVKGGEFAMHGWPGAVSEVNVDAVADSREIRITHANARFAGGTVGVTATVPLKGFELSQGEATVALRDIHVAPAAGIATTFDADLNLSMNTKATGSPTAGLPHVSGDVLITSFEYTRPVNLELNAFGLGSKRTNVDTYDPSLDIIAFDGVRIRSRAPLKIHNNLVEVQLGIDSNALAVSGTDQRFGLRGELRALPGGRFHLRANDFDVKQAIIRFDDPTRIAPNVDVLGVTEYRRYSDTSASAAAGAAAAGGTAGSRNGIWRISLHAYGDADNLRLDMTSDPPLSQEDIVLLLTIGMTRAEVDQLQAGSLGASAALEALATVSGADRAVKSAIPVIDDFRFGSAYSTLTGRTEPQVIVGKRLTENVRANVATTIAESRELRSNIEWRLNRRVSVQGSYDNINDVSSSSVGNVGVDFRWRLEFQ